MNRSTLEWYEQMSRGLVWAGAVVLVLAVVGSIIIAGSDNALPLFEDVERQGRGVAALASLGIGLTSAGLLAGVGAILRLMVTERLEALGPAPEQPIQKLAERAERKPAQRQARKPAPVRGRPRREERADRRDRDEADSDDSDPDSEDA